MSSKSERSLQDVVGKETYTVWVNVLRELVPDGRTHRLSVVIAGMLQYATAIAEKLDEEELEEDSVALSLINANEMDPDQLKRELHDIVRRLFKDAGVTFDRVSRRGEPYSIADETMNISAGTTIRGNKGEPMKTETITQRDDLIVRRHIMEPGEALPWHRDLCHRFTVVVTGELLHIEYRDTGQIESIPVHPGLADWNAPQSRVHRGINVGTVTYEEVIVFFIDEPGMEPQPEARG